MLGSLRRTLLVLAAVAIVVLSGLAVAAPAQAAAGTTTLRGNEQLSPGQRLITATGISLVMQTDGRLVEYAPGNRAVWAITTYRPGTVLRMQTDGNLVLLAPGNLRVWSTRTGGNAGAFLELQPNGNAVVLTTARVAKWSNGVRIAPTPPPTTAPSTTAPSTTAPSTTAPTTTAPTTTAPTTTAPTTTVPTTTVPTTAPTTTRPAPTSTPAPTTAPASGTAAQVVSLTNTERTRGGCTALVTDPRLTTAAQGHATDMAMNLYFSHTSQDGRTFDRRIRDAGYPSPGGENIARGYTTPSAVVTAWMNSTGHRANILNCNFRAIGVGHDTRGNYWVQNFGY